MITIEKSILDVKKGIVLQQVNCKGVMGAGLALQFANMYPKVLPNYLKYLEVTSKPLGTAKGIKLTDDLLMLMIFGQNAYGTEQRHTNYEAVIAALVQFQKYLKDNPNSEVFVPYGMGCGLGGGNWKVMQELIREYLDPHCKLTICKVTQKCQ